MPGEIDHRAPDRAAASPFDSPEVAARFNPFGPWNASPTPRPRLPTASSHSHGSPGWNFGPLGALTNGRAVSAGTRVLPPTKETSPVNGIGAHEVTEAQWARYQNLKAADCAKNDLIEELYVQNIRLNEQLQKAIHDHDREIEWNRGSQDREKARVDEISRMRMRMEQDPFVLILIDGDNLTFRPELLAKGEEGGLEAAALLHEGVLKYVRGTIDGLHDDLRIVVRVFADTKRLGETNCKANIINRPCTVEDFTTGFTGYHGLFDITNVSYSKTRLVEKIHEHIKLNMYIPNCRQIFLGGAKQNRSLLQELESDETTLNRVTLIGGPMESGPIHCSLEIIYLRKVFRESNLTVQTSGGALNNVFSGDLPTPPPSMPSISRQLSEISIKDVKDFRPSLPTAMSASTTSTKSSPKPSPAPLSVRPNGDKTIGNSWATLAAKPPPVAPPAPAAPLKVAEPPTQAITKNRLGQRIDAVMKHDKNEVDRVKRLKMCNVHYLRGECGFGNDCSHSHKHKSTKGELETLRLVARMAPCMYGSDCEEVKCIYGHVCPAPEGRNGEDCIFGNACRFPTELHKIDRTATKV